MFVCGVNLDKYDPKEDISESCSLLSFFSPRTGEVERVPGKCCVGYAFD